MNREVFAESEKRFLTTEILKASSVPLEKIVLLFNEQNEDPRWEHIYIPPGRTLQECKIAFEALRTAPYSAYGLPSSPALYRTPYALIPDSPASSRTAFYKRKADNENVESSPSLSLEPKRRLSGVRGQEILIQQPILPKPISRDVVASISDLTRRRSRPPKSETEQWQQAIGRGEILSPQTIVTQIRHVPSEEKMGQVSSQSSPVSAAEATSSQVLTPSRKVGTNIKRQGSSKRPSEGRFSLDQFIHLPPMERSSSSKNSKSRAAHPAGPESASGTKSSDTSSNQDPSNTKSCLIKAKELEKSTKDSPTTE